MLVLKPLVDFKALLLLVRVTACASAFGMYYPLKELAANLRQYEFVIVEQSLNKTC